MPTPRIHTFLLILVLIGSSCKYEEGPLVSLRSKKERVANEWRIEKIIEADGTEREKVEDHWTFTKDGEVYVNGNENGRWKFSSDKEGLILDHKAAPEENFEILRLKEQELWLENANDDEIRFVAS